MGARFEDVYRNTHLKQERGAQVEAIRAEVFQAYANRQDSESDLVATAMGAAAASLGGLGGLGPSTSNPDTDPAVEDEEEEEDETVPEAPKEDADLSLKKNQGASATSSSTDSPSQPPPEEEAQAGISGRNPSDNSARDPIVQTAIGAAALGLGGVGGLGRTTSEPSMAPGEEEQNSSRVLPMGRIAATPAQVSRALKVLFTSPVLPASWFVCLSACPSVRPSAFLSARQDCSTSHAHGLRAVHATAATAAYRLYTIISAAL